jgi:CDP-glucose 4,6-dehydratase
MCHQKTIGAGNVIGCGDWAADRIVPDAMRALGRGEPIGVCNPAATRPWQHVLEPISGYLCLAERHSVRELVEEELRHWPGTWIDQIDAKAPHEAPLLNLLFDKAPHRLGWAPRWDFATTVACTVGWYRRVEEGQASALESCLADLVSLAATPTR